MIKFKHIAATVTVLGVGTITAGALSPQVREELSLSPQSCYDYLAARYLQDPVALRHVVRLVKPLVAAGAEEGVLMFFLDTKCGGMPYVTIDAVVVSTVRWCESNPVTKESGVCPGR